MIDKAKLARYYVLAVALQSLEKHRLQKVKKTKRKGSSRKSRI